MEKPEPVRSYPFITTCLALGASQTHGNDYENPIKVLNKDLKFEDLDEPMHYFFFDITEPDKPKFTFAENGELGATGRGRQPGQPRFAIYMFDPPELIEDNPWEVFQNGIREDEKQRLEALPVVSADAIRQLWDPDLQVHHSEDYEDFYVPHRAAAQEASASSTSLRDLALARTVDQAFHTPPQDSVWLSEASQLPDFLPTVRDKLFAEPHLIQTPSGPTLLRQILKDGQSPLVNLSMFPGLQAQDVVGIIRDAAEKPTGAGLTAILPDLPTMTINELRQIGHAARYEGLHLGATGNLDLETVVRITSEGKIKKFTCPALFARMYENEGQFDSAAAAQLLDCF